MTTRPDRAPLDDRAKLTIGEVAKWLNLKHADSVQFYLGRARKARAKGDDHPWLFPEPDGRDPLTGTAWWYGRTIKRWDASRLGRGYWRVSRSSSTAPATDKST